MKKLENESIIKIYYTTGLTESYAVKKRTAKELMEKAKSLDWSQCGSFNFNDCVINLRNVVKISIEE